MRGLIAGLFWGTVVSAVCIVIIAWGNPPAQVPDGAEASSNAASEGAEAEIGEAPPTAGTAGPAQAPGQSVETVPLSPSAEDPPVTAPQTPPAVDGSDAQDAAPGDTAPSAVPETGALDEDTGADGAQASPDANPEVPAQTTGAAQGSAVAALPDPETLAPETLAPETLARSANDIAAPVVPQELLEIAQTPPVEPAEPAVEATTLAAPAAPGDPAADTVAWVAELNPGIARAAAPAAPGQITADTADITVPAPVSAADLVALTRPLGRPDVQPTERAITISQRPTTRPSQPVIGAPADATITAPAGEDLPGVASVLALGAQSTAGPGSLTAPTAEPDLDALTLAAADFAAARPEPELPVEETVAAAPVAAAPVAEAVEEDAPQRTATATVAALQEPAEPVRIQLSGSSGFSGLQTGVRINRLAPADDPQPVAAEPAPLDPDAPPLLAHAAPFENPDALPMVAVVLIDDGADGTTRADLSDLPFAVTLALDPGDVNASQIGADYVAAGGEVAVISELPFGATPSDVAVLLGAGFERVPQAVALLDAGDGGVADSRSAAIPAVGLLADEGRGLVVVSNGLSPALREAEAAGVSATRISRNLTDSQGGALSRALDQAAFAARRDGDVVLMGRLTAETLAALRSWASSPGGRGVALAPVSAVLQAQISAEG